MAIATLNDGTNAPPRLRCYLCLGTILKLPATSSFAGGEGEAAYAAIREAGYEGVQRGDMALCEKYGLRSAGAGRINTPDEAEPLVKQEKDAGRDCVTVHVGWGLEDDATMDALADAIREASAKHDFPVYIETHRATMTQDLWRTVQLLQRKPDLHINADFSHWYTGLELPYGGMPMKLDFMQSVFDRVRFMHGRIGSSGCMQVDIADGADDAPQICGPVNFLADYREMWTRAMMGFLSHADSGDYLVFAPELIPGGAYYARVFPNAAGELVEESDRWQQALVYCRIARECFAEARRRLTND